MVLEIPDSFVSREYLLMRQPRPSTNIIVQNHPTGKRELARQFRSAMTEAEQTLWQHLRAHQCEGRKFRRQQILRGFIVDFYCHEERLAVEVDGAVHEGHTEYDAERTEILNREGVRVVRVTNGEVNERLEDALARIRACFRDREDRS